MLSSRQVVYCKTHHQEITYAFTCVDGFDKNEVCDYCDAVILVFEVAQ